MDMLISVTPLSFTEFSDFVVASVDWFIPSLNEMSDLNGWILKMYLNGSMYYFKSDSEIIGLAVTYYNIKRISYISLIFVYARITRGMELQDSSLIISCHNSRHTYMKCIWK